VRWPESAGLTGSGDDVQLRAERARVGQLRRTGSLNQLNRLPTLFGLLAVLFPCHRDRVLSRVGGSDCSDCFSHFYSTFRLDSGTSQERLVRALFEQKPPGSRPIGQLADSAPSLFVCGHSAG
jgi:hypothetical protein